jgi:hypothetical protein
MPRDFSVFEFYTDLLFPPAIRYTVYACCEFLKESQITEGVF